MTQSEESRLLLPESVPGIEGINSESAPVKIMEEGSHVFVVDNFSAHAGIGMGKWIESSPFVVGPNSKGYSFTIRLFPDGADADANRHGYISLFVMNNSPKAVPLVYSLHLVDHTATINQYGVSSSLDTRSKYHRVDNSLPGTLFGSFDFIELSSIHKYYARNESIFIRATIGVFLDNHDHDHDHQQLPPIAKSSIERQRCIIFQVGDQLLYEKESVITTQCPALISDYPQSNNIVLISDVDPHVFKAVLWFLNNKSIHRVDRNTIENPIANPDGSFTLKMLEAADKFNLKDLRTQICELLGIFGNLQVLCSQFEIEPTVKELWRKVSSWMPQKMKAA